MNKADLEKLPDVVCKAWKSLFAKDKKADLRREHSWTVFANAHPELFKVAIWRDCELPIVVKDNIVSVCPKLVKTIGRTQVSKGVGKAICGDVLAHEYTVRLEGAGGDIHLGELESADKITSDTRHEYFGHDIVCGGIELGSFTITVEDAAGEGVCEITSAKSRGNVSSPLVGAVINDGEGLSGGKCLEDPQKTKMLTYAGWDIGYTGKLCCKGSFDPAKLELIYSAAELPDGSHVQLIHRLKYNGTELELEEDDGREGEGEWSWIVHRTLDGKVKVETIEAVLEHNAAVKEAEAEKRKGKGAKNGKKAAKESAAPVVLMPKTGEPVVAVVTDMTVPEYTFAVALFITTARQYDGNLNIRLVHAGSGGELAERMKTLGSEVRSIQIIGDKLVTKLEPSDKVKIERVLAKLPRGMRIVRFCEEMGVRIKACWDAEKARVIKLNPNGIPKHLEDIEKHYSLWFDSGVSVVVGAVPHSFGWDSLHDNLWDGQAFLRQRPLLREKLVASAKKMSKSGSDDLFRQAVAELWQYIAENGLIGSHKNGEEIKCKSMKLLWGGARGK